MIICKECGFTAQRLQWTHFKYNCTGKFKNGREYLAAYPGEKLVDPEVCKKTAITLENLKKKYGVKEGENKWAEYRTKQAHSNSLEYKREKLGWTVEQFNEYNKNRSTTLENLIRRHGEEVGIKKWQEYCDRQSYTKAKEYLIKKYGEVDGLQKYHDINRKKAATCNPKILSEILSITVDEAVDLICSRSSLRFNSNIEKEFIRLLESEIGELDHSSLKSPFGKWCSTLEKYVVYDIKHKDCIIEFNGDYWHANPSKYKATDIIRGKSVQDIWDSENKKLNLARSLGFRVLIIWESDYINDKAKTIKDTIKWISNEQQ